MKKLLLLLLLTGTYGFSQAVYNNFSPTVKGVTIKNSHCYVWAKLGLPYDTEVVCWEGAVLKKLIVGVANETIVGYFITADGQFTFLIFPRNGVMNFQLSGTPATGTTVYQTGVF